MLLRKPTKTLFPSHLISQRYQSTTGHVRPNRPTVTANLPLSQTLEPIVGSFHVDSALADRLELPAHRRKTRLLLSRKPENPPSIDNLRAMLIHRFPQLASLDDWRISYRLLHLPGENSKKRIVAPRTSTINLLQTDDDLISAMNSAVQANDNIYVAIHGAGGIIKPHISRAKLSVVSPGSTAQDAAHELATTPAEDEAWRTAEDVLSKLQLSADPLEATSYTPLSFFSFLPISNATIAADFLHRLWKPFHTVGRVYVAKEGVNAQIAIPSNVRKEFEAVTSVVPFLKTARFNADVEISRSDFAANPPFTNLHVRVREQILRDGLEDPLDWQRAGTELEPMEWHQKLVEAGFQLPSTDKIGSVTKTLTDNSNSSAPILIDCRNLYETDVGTFVGAKPIVTTTFRDSWAALDELLADTPRDAPVMTFCTGGIRCVKVNAYLEQHLGFKNTSRLRGGIVAYRRELETASKSDTADMKDLRSRFVGINYVFDERIAERVTDDVLTTCEMCGCVCDTFQNCRSTKCNVRFLQCHSCNAAYSGCCSVSCRHEVDGNKKVISKYGFFSNTPSVSHHSSPESSSLKTHADSSGALSEALDSYASSMSISEPEPLRLLREDIENNRPSGASRMLSGPSQGSLLSFLATQSKAQAVLELGTFVGYATAAMVADFRSLPELVPARRVYTCDSSADSIRDAQNFFDAAKIADSIDARHMTATDMISTMRLEGLHFDMVFIDADKKAYIDYLKAIIGESPNGTQEETSILRPGALIIVDNVLWKGLVLAHDSQLASSTPNAADFGNAGRHEKIASSMHAFNEYAANSKSLKQLMLPLRDGLTILQYVP